MTRIAVVAHALKRLGGADLQDLRAALADAGVVDPLWYEVPKSKESPKQARKAVEKGAQLVLVWGGDGTVRRCIEELAGHERAATDLAVGILPAGTANLMAGNLGIPIDLAGAIDVALHGRRRRLDLGVANGKRFAGMAGIGFDAVMVAGADEHKDRFGRVAYVWAGLKALREDRVATKVTVDGDLWFDGEAACVLIGNTGTISGGLVVFEDAQPDDGRLEVGVTTADGLVEWSRVLGRLARGQAAESALVHTTSGTRIDVQLARPVAWELDGGDRKPTRRLKITIEPSAIAVCVPV